MKTQIRFMLEYQCYPIWIYSEDGELLYNDLVDEIANNFDLCDLLERLQLDFDSLYLDTSREFRYVGFENENDKAVFLDRAKKVYEELLVTLGDQYEIVNEVDASLL